MVLIEDPNESPSEKEQEQPIVGLKETHNTGQQPPAQANHIESSNSNNAGDDNPEILFKMVIQAAKKLWDQLKSTSHFVMVDLGGYQLVNRLVKWCVQHPQMALCLPAAGFVTFLISVGFALSKGTLLTILPMMLFGLLGVLVIVFLFFAVVEVAVNFESVRTYDIYGNGECQEDDLVKIWGNSIVNSTVCVRCNCDPCDHKLPSIAALPVNDDLLSTKIKSPIS